MIKLKQLLLEKTLYHGTITDFIPNIKEHGLIPIIGQFVKQSYSGAVDDNIEDYLSTSPSGDYSELLARLEKLEKKEEVNADDTGITEDNDGITE